MTSACTVVLMTIGLRNVISTHITLAHLLHPSLVHLHLPLLSPVLRQQPKVLL
ncbi:uncharacterized protein P174DRAFT_441231 [Aspergillus novofumigatus IBT 16806]|uniref:Uncharacterized protein n=1 Tax=Aspergillus novofumigatus (strain IBT 16806) TaxID=1392255 RepID=A0A2I1C8J2_ASPN1|nr:uncharacterized protein P174DRAFT_441231 [Aspergillus novofumigatus IBT 16806]PKX93968.1 hypothetical protein P174DRAFT_441231 [Aspergillus novofumigatus IBT 16806]